MSLNPFPRKARKWLDAAGIAYTYVEYGSYLGGWRKRLPLKMWTAGRPFHMIFVRGQFIGGADDLARLDPATLSGRGRASSSARRVRAVRPSARAGARGLDRLRRRTRGRRGETGTSPATAAARAQVGGGAAGAAVVPPERSRARRPVRTSRRPLDPAHPSGTQIDLHVAVVPAVARQKLADPIFFFAGGPGQSAISLAGTIEQLLTPGSSRVATWS